MMRGFLKENAAAFGIDVSQLGKVSASQVTDTLWQISVPQVVNGIAVRDARFMATISYGNLIMMGTEVWGNVKIDTNPKISAAQALGTWIGNLTSYSFQGHGRRSLRWVSGWRL